VRSYKKEELLATNLFVHWGGNSSWVRVKDTNLLFCYEVSAYMAVECSGWDENGRWYVAANGQWLSPSQFTLDMIGLYRGIKKGGFYLTGPTTPSNLQIDRYADLKYAISGITDYKLREELAAFFKKTNKKKKKGGGKNKKKS
jgi:hypothetical protein